MAMLRFIQELLGIRPGITKSPQSRNVKKDVESEQKHFLGADGGQCRGEDSGKPFPPLKNVDKIRNYWFDSTCFFPNRAKRGADEQLGPGSILRRWQ